MHIFKVHALISFDIWKHPWNCHLNGVSLPITPHNFLLLLCNLFHWFAFTQPLPRQRLVCFLSLSANLHFLSLYKWNYIMYIPLYMALFNQHNCFEIHHTSSMMYLSKFIFSCWIAFPFIEMPQFVYTVTYGWEFGLLSVWAY